MYNGTALIRVPCWQLHFTMEYVIHLQRCIVCIVKSIYKLYIQIVKSYFHVYKIFDLKKGNRDRMVS